jgi:hopanoid biosynthesis associated RND transporter like protein HpnN
MLRSLDEKLGALAARMVAASNRRPVLVLALVSAITPLFGVYTARTLGVNADMASLVSNELPHRILELDYQRAFPFLYENLVVVVDAPTPEESSAAAARLAEAMEGDAEHFHHVFYPGGEFFERHALLYANPEDLERFADRLTRVQPYLSSLAEDGTLRGLSMMMTRGLAAVRDGEFQGGELGAMLEHYSAAIRALERGEPYRVSWTEIVAGGAGAGAAEASRRHIIIAQPVLDLSRVLAAEQPIERVRELGRRLDSSRVRVRITGDMALSYEELSIVKFQTVLASIASFFIVAATMILAFRSVRMTVLASLNMLVGLVWTLTFATVAVGELNMISVAFAVLFIGLSDDYGIHFCMRYRELLRAGRRQADALEETARGAGASICICAVTTAIGFYAFVPTDFRGVAELGLISGTGMFINVLLCFTLLPAMISVAKPGGTSAEATAVTETRRRTVSFPVRYPRAVGTVTVMAALAAAMLVPKAYFDGNPLNVRDPTAESVKAFQDLLGDGRGAPWNMSVVVNDRGEAQALIDRLRELPAVQSAITVDDFVPKEQDEKIAILEDIAFFLPPSGRRPDDFRPATPEEQLSAIRDLRAELDKAATDEDRGKLTAQSRALRDDLDRWLASLGNPANTATAIATLETSLLGTLPEQLETVERALRPSRVTLDALPRAIVDRMVAADGRLRIEIAPTKDLTDEAALTEFVEAVRTVTPNAAGGAIGVYEGKRAVVTAFQEAFAMAVIAIALLLLVIWRTVGDTILVMIPLALAALFTTALAVMLGIPFNFADVIVLPLLFGLGVNSGIHLVERWRLGDTTAGHLLETSTAQAVVYSSLNTIGAFGTLGFTTHRGMASMGQLLALGVALTVICNLFVLPALIELRSRHSRRNTTGTANT